MRTDLTFDDAMRALLNGARVARAKWRSAYVGFRDEEEDRGGRLVLRVAGGLYPWSPHSVDRGARDWMEVPRELWHVN